MVEGTCSGGRIGNERGDSGDCAPEDTETAGVVVMVLSWVGVPPRGEDNIFRPNFMNPAYNFELEWLFAVLDVVEEP